MSMDQQPDQFIESLRAALAADEAVEVTAADVVTARLRERVGLGSGGIRKDRGRAWREYSGKSLQERLIGAGAARKSSGTGVGGKQLKNWDRWAVGALAAAVFALVFIGFEYLSVRQHPGFQSKTYSTSLGQRAKIQLADGSQVILSPATTIRVAGRKVELSGEAVFTVIKHTKEPFTVHANNAVTRVLGTTFGVRAIAGEQRVRVVVAEGKVSVGSTTLTIGNAATVNADGVISIERNANIATLLGWTEGRLVFDNATVGEMLVELGRWYGLELRMADPADASQLVNASFETRERPSQVISSVSRMLNARTIRKGSIITFIKE